MPQEFLHFGTCTNKRKYIHCSVPLVLGPHDFVRCVHRQSERRSTNKMTCLSLVIPPSQRGLIPEVRDNPSLSSFIYPDLVNDRQMPVFNPNQHNF